MAENKPKIKNRSALRDYFIEKTYEAGIELLGNEVKSIRAGNVNLKGSFARLEKGEVFIYNMHISPYEFTREECDPMRTRKLLLHKSEVRQLFISTEQKGYALVPLKIYFKRSYVKVELGLGKGKKHYDKRRALKEKAVNKEIDRALKNS